MFRLSGEGLLTMVSVDCIGRCESTERLLALRAPPSVLLRRGFGLPWFGNDAEEEPELDRVGAFDFLVAAISFSLLDSLI